MYVYQPGMPIADAEPVGIDNEATQLGGRMLAGNPQLAVRVDFQAGPMLASIFEATTGVAEVHFPFTELATILEGEVTITDATRQSHTYRPGETYFIR